MTRDATSDGGEPEWMALARVTLATKHRREPAQEDLAAILRLALDRLKRPPTDVRLDVRSALLRRAWRDFHTSVGFTAAARLISEEWRTYEESPARAMPGTKAEIFERLGRAGFKRLSWRRIADLIDPVEEERIAQSCTKRARGAQR